MTEAISRIVLGPVYDMVEYISEHPSSINEEILAPKMLGAFMRVVKIFLVLGVALGLSLALLAFEIMRFIS